MKVRQPDFDFSSIRPHWAPVREFAQSYNAFSTVPAHIEPFLVKVMMRVKESLGDKHPALRESIEIFNKQEVQHCKQHVAFNKMLYRSGYAGMQELEKPYRDDYASFLENKSLRFNVAYCEGFEAMGSAAGQVFFEELDEYLEGADQAAVDLWKWHLAEEFEHREVCFQVYETLYGKGLFAYLYRVWAFIYAVKHIGTHTAKVSAYLNDMDREKMTPEERDRSLERQKILKSKISKASRSRLLRVLSPFYNPGKMVPSPGMAALLARFS
ncbi:metal-dependent hydrolase [Pseudomonas nitroreducens]|uniref:Metal-dependent hydrolase n=1 Tax=Pseudomonas nitroreducens TaxID=46680 RepID=A0ABS0KG16_PSENT|nr:MULTISPECIES: metal-dependent hydrolase [Pseudomonas aeruginosa group]MBG6287017.1 metal-dependent hydrolase [Pseudomonas nitroreducens]